MDRWSGGGIPRPPKHEVLSMSLLKISNALSVVREVTGEDPGVVGASIFVDRELHPTERSEIQTRLDPQTIERAGFPGERKTRIDL